MRANLAVGLDLAKGLAVAWQRPLLGIHHMQAHALTPRLVHAMAQEPSSDNDNESSAPAFPFLTILASGGHTQILRSRSLCDHSIIANTSDIALGLMLDKAARELLPADILSAAQNVSYGALLEEFAFGNAETIDYVSMLRPEHNHWWSLTQPFSKLGKSAMSARNAELSFSGMGSQAASFVLQTPNMDVEHRRSLARELMRCAFEHLGSRVLIALQREPEEWDVEPTHHLVVSGGVASNRYLRHMLRTQLDAAGWSRVGLLFPPPSLCTDNAAMVAWAGMEMWRAGWQSELSIRPVQPWSLDATDPDGGVLGVDGWVK